MSLTLDTYLRWRNSDKKKHNLIDSCWLIDVRMMICVSLSTDNYYIYVHVFADMSTPHGFPWLRLIAQFLTAFNRLNRTLCLCFPLCRVPIRVDAKHQPNQSHITGQHRSTVRLRRAVHSGYTAAISLKGAAIYLHKYVCPHTVRAFAYGAFELTKWNLYE